jgi:beta-glucosidase
MTTQLRPTRPADDIDGRVADLVGQMTLREKIAQLGSAWSFEVVGTGAFDAARAAALLGQGIGQITRLAGATNLGIRDVATLANEIQRYLVEGTRLGIPAILHEESLHGLLSRDAPVFQQSIGAAAA